jgi:hypothetical protein
MCKDMNKKAMSNKFEDLRQNLMTDIPELVSTQQCNDWLNQYEISDKAKRSQLESQMLDDCQKMLFIDDLDTSLKNYFNSHYTVFYSTFDKVDSSAVNHNLNTFWHCDGGVSGTLKLFVYLNSVNEHGGNTLIIDKPRTDMLRAHGHLPLEQKMRKLVVTQVLQQLCLSTELIAYPLNAGDVLLFDPVQLAHKCLAPTADKIRYTLCYTIVPVLVF